MSHKLTLLSVFLSALIVAQPPLVFSQEGDLKNWLSGPIQVPNTYPPAQLHLTWAPRAPMLTENEETNFEALWAWTSSAILQDTYRVDVESHTLNLTLAVPISRQFELGFKIPLVWRDEGVADGFIDDWHKTFQLPRGDRNDMPENDFNISGIQSNQQRFGLERDGFGFGNAQVSGSYLLTKGDQRFPAVSFELDFGLPTATDEYGQQGLDVLGGVIASKRLKDLALYAGFSNIYYSDIEVEKIFYNRNHLEGFIGLEYLALDYLTLLLSLHGGGGILDKLPEHPDYFLYLDFGLNFRLSQDSSLALVIRENPGAGRGSSDISSVLALRQGL